MWTWGWRAYFVGRVDFAPFAVHVFFTVHRQVVAFVLKLLAEGFAAQLCALDHAAQGAVQTGHELAAQHLQELVAGWDHDIDGCLA